MSSVNVGDTAPDFSLPAQTGEDFRLSEKLGPGPVILFFYPSDDTPICGTEICAFRDQVESFAQVPCQVAGISSDSVETHRRFAEVKHVLFPLLSDRDNAVRNLYGAKYLWVFPSRTTFIINAKGVVIKRFDSQLNAAAHVRFALDTLASI